MANNFNITISAVDKATATIKKINAATDKMTRPLSNIGRSLGALKKEAGMNKVVKSMTALGKASGHVVEKIAKIGAPLATLVGGGTIAGLYELATGWAKIGAETGRTAQILGVGASSLDAMRNAGRLFGIDAATTTSTMQTFANTLQDAKWGRNQGAYALLRGMGITLKTTKTGAIDADSAMDQLADKIHQIQQRDPGAARHLAESLGVTALLPILMQGSAAMKKYRADAQRLAGTKTPEMIQRATDFSLAINGMKVAFDGVENSIGDKLIPVFMPLVKQWTNWLVTNRALIGTKVAEWVGRVGAIAEKLYQKVTKLVQSMGGWGNVLKIVGGIIALSFIAPIIAAIAQIGLLAVALGGLSTGMLAAGGVAAAFMFAADKVWNLVKAMQALHDVKEDAKAREQGSAGVAGAMTPDTKRRIAAMNKGSALGTVKFFESKGWSPAQAVGIAANIQKESGYNPNQWQIGGGDGYGLGQWGTSRRALFKKQFGHEMQNSTGQEQLEFYNWELHHSESKAGALLSRATTPRQAAGIVSMFDERPGDQQGEIRKRGDIADQINVVVQNQTTVHPSGAVTTKTTTPSGVKIGYTAPAPA